jgi:hypothetical protein
MTPLDSSRSCRAFYQELQEDDSVCIKNHLRLLELVLPCEPAVLFVFEVKLTMPSMI